MFKASLAEMQDITTAKVGDKTMMDTLIPAVKAIADAQVGSFKELFKIGAEAAEQGAEDTKNMYLSLEELRVIKRKRWGIRMQVLLL